MRVRALCDRVVRLHLPRFHSQKERIGGLVVFIASKHISRLVICLHSRMFIGFDALHMRFGVATMLEVSIIAARPWLYCHVVAVSGSQWQSIHMFFSPAAPEVEVARVQLYVAVRAIPS